MSSEISMAPSFNAHDVAKYFVRIGTNVEQEEFLTNLKVQKLLYYAQAFHLALNNAILFHEDIEAWQYGPVVRSVYDELKQYSSGPIDIAYSETCTIDEDSFLSQIYDIFGPYSASKLVSMTHSEPPWRDSWNPDNPREVISLESMKEYFQKFITTN